VPAVSNSQRNTLFRVVVLIGMVLAWAAVWHGVQELSGLFRAIGVDFALYRAQTLAFLAGGGSALYDLRALSQQLQPLQVYTTNPTLPLEPGLASYPALFIWLFIPFAKLSPLLGFALWTLLNFGAAVYLGLRTAQFFSKSDRWWVTGLVLTCFPVFFALLTGQPVIVLGCAIAEAMISFSAGRPLRAGLWVAVLALKPEYIVLVGLLLLWKRQWRAVLGAAAGAAAIVAGSVLVAGPAAVLTYPAALSDKMDFHGSGGPVFPSSMINWRGLILRLAPAIENHTGLLLTVVLGLVTVGLAAWALRGPWAATRRGLASTWVIVIVATLLAGYHSHGHGAVLLIPPMAAFAAEGSARRLGSLAVKVLIALPTVICAAYYSSELAAWPLTIGMILLFVAAWGECEEVQAEARLRTAALRFIPRVS